MPAVLRIAIEVKEDFSLTSSVALGVWKNAISMRYQPRARISVQMACGGQ
jgi:hypothetical protein